MLKKGFQIAGTVIVGGIFLWLAFRNIDLSEIWNYARTIRFGWILPFIAVAIISHYLRAERWKLLIEHDKGDLDRFTLFSGVMVGYLLNLAVPRLGEISRPVYVAKKERLSSSKLIGTIVLERAIDIVTMGFLMLVVTYYLISDPSLLDQIFGENVMALLESGTRLKGILIVILIMAITVVVVMIGWKVLEFLGTKFVTIEKLVLRIRQLIRMFVEGLIAARKVRKWWLFIILTVLIWIGYTLMTYIPFSMFDMQSQFGLTFLDALTITVISAIGITIPSPGGLGTYHYFVKQALLILFAVPAVTGLAYATITHAAMALLVIGITPVILAIDKYRHMKSEKLQV